MPAVSWPSEASFSVWISRSCAAAQILQRRCQFARAGFDTFEQADVLDGDRRLVGEGRRQFDLLVGERPHLGARHDDDADRLAFAQHRHAEDGAKIAQPLRLVEGVVGICLDVGNVNDDPLEQRAAVAEPRSGTTGTFLT